MKDDGGTANGGVDTDPSPKTMTVNVTWVNQAPVGAGKTVTTLEDTAYVLGAADFGFTDPNDSPANALLAVKITTLPGAGTLTDNGVAVTAGQFVPVADITGNKLIFTPVATYYASPYTSFTFQVQDNGGTANGGVDTDPIPKAMTIDVTFVNHAPVGTSTTVTTLEDKAYTFQTADFGFSDPNDNPPNALKAVEITTVPGAGTLTDNGTTVTAGQFVPLADITGNKLVFTPVTTFWGAAYASFTFQVQDNGGTANGGVDTDPNPKTMTVNVAEVDHAPSGTSKTLTIPEDTTYALQVGDFGFSDPNDNPANHLNAVEITTVPAAGTLADNGTAVTAGQFVPVADITGNKLTYTPALHTYGNPNPYTSFTFQVQDDGGTANGGVDTDPSPKTMTINVTSVNDAPVGTNNTVTTLEDTAYTFKIADFGFSDPNDNPPNHFKAVEITTLPAAGSLTDNGTAVTAGEFVPVADLSGNKLIFTPVTTDYGSPYTSFTFQVQDDGGTANGGVDTDPNPKTMTIDVPERNHAPLGTNNTVTTLEDTAYTFKTADFGFSDPNDTPANTLKAVVITTVPAAGTLTDNGTAVTAGQFVPVADITGNKLIFTPATTFYGSPYASFTFQVQDDGGTANGGVDTDPNPKTMTVDVPEVNHAPTGANNTVTTLEDSAYTFKTADFGFSDPNDNPANTLKAVEITTVPAAGTLTDDGTAVTAGQFVAVADITGNKLIFTPATTYYGAAYAKFTFQVQDNGGTANGGVDTDPTPRTMTVNVNEVDHAPVGTNNTVTTLEDKAYTFKTADFGFSDPNDNPANTLKAVEITTVPTAGTLTDNGTAVTAGHFVPVADITGNKLVFTPATTFYGSPYGSFTFQVQDNGGTANGGVDTDPNPKTMTVDVTFVNHAPLGTSTTVTTLEDTAYTFKTADFGFSDPNDNPPNTLKAVEITTLPAAGQLTDKGVAVTAGEFVPVADITGNKLVFTPVTTDYGSPYASFTFQVQDNGGTANGGVDTDPNPKTMTIDVPEVNHAPTGTSNTVTTLEDTAYTFKTADFGFSDPNDNPANTLKAVEITTVPTAGTLADNGTAVTAGQFVPVADITGNKLVLTPTATYYGSPYASFEFQVQDNGGTANGGVDTDPNAKTMTVDVPEVNHAPIGANNTVTILEDAAYTFKTADFGFSDPNDNPPNNFKAVDVTTLPVAGNLTDNGVAVNAGQSIPVGDISGGKFVFTPAANTNGTPYASFGFQVQDDGGTANGGSDTSAAYTFVIDVPKDSSLVAVSSSTPSSVVGQTVTFTATVSSAGPSTATPAGTVDFLIDNIPVASGVTLVNGQPTYQTSSLTISGSPHSVTVNFHDTDTFFTNSSGTLAGGQTVGKDNTTTAVSSSVAAAVTGQGVTFTAVVSAASPGSGTPAGTVDFVIDNITVATGVPLVNGQATYQTSSLSVTGSPHTVTVNFHDNDGLYNNSTGTLAGGETIGSATTTTAAAHAPGHSAFGVPVTFMATVSAVSPGGGIPDGSVTFLIDSVPEAPFSLNASGQVSFTTSTLAIGTHIVQATYSGSASYVGSGIALAGGGYTVTPANTSTTLAADFNPSRPKEPVTFTATVVTTAPVVPTGNVTFAIDGTAVATVNLTGTTASFTIASLGLGSHTVIATYNGASLLSPSSDTVTQVVEPAGHVRSRVALTSSLNPSTYGDAVTFTAVVSGAAGTPTGAVAFFVKGVFSGAVSLDSTGQAQLTLTDLPGGHDSIRAVYYGDDTYKMSARGRGETVHKAATTTSIASSGVPAAVVGTPITFTATVASGALTPDGTVTFIIDGTRKATVPLVAGQAAYTTSTLAVGNYAVIAKYNGNRNFTVSRDTLSQVVQEPGSLATTSVVTSSLNPAQATDQVTFTATVTGPSGAGTPTGWVRFSVAGVLSVPVALNGSGQALYTPALLPEGTFNVDVVYYGDLMFAASTSPDIDQTVIAVPMRLSAVITQVPTSPGSGAADFFLTVDALTASGAVASTDNDPVSFSVASAPPGGTVTGTNSGVLSSGSAVFSDLAVNTPGTYTLDIVSDSFMVSVTFTLSANGRLT